MIFGWAINAQRISACIQRWIHARRPAVQRRLKAGELTLLAKGMATSRPATEWPALIARDRIRVLAALFPGATRLQTENCGRQSPHSRSTV